MADFKSGISPRFRAVARSAWQIIIPLLLEYFPVRLLWKRKDVSDWPVPGRNSNREIENYEYSLFSQNGEDGIIRFLFSEITFTSRSLVEFGFGVVQNNSLRLILNEAFTGLLIDGSAATVRAFNKAARQSGITNVRAVDKFLDLENLRTTLLEHGAPRNIDFLSIDVDGNDYWFWKDITYLDPRVVVIEYNASLGPDLSLTVAYDPQFDRHRKHLSGFYHGASLTALTRLANEKGYALVGCDSNGINAFFVRNDCLGGALRAIDPQSAYRPHAGRVKKGFSPEEQFKIIQDLPFVTIE